MGKEWTTAEQKKWLSKRLPQYLDEQKNDRTSRFLLTVNEEWFKDFPEEDALLFASEDGQSRSAEEIRQLAAAMEVRKTQLRNWFSWKARERRASSGSSQSSSFVTAIQANEWQKAPRRRAPQRTEVYQRLYPKKIKAQIERQLALLKGPIKQADRMRIQRQVTSSMLSKETPAVIEQVNGQIALWREKRAKQEKDAMEEKAASHTPREFQAAIDGLPGVLKTAMQACADATGWVFFISAGGPLPRSKGDVFMERFYFGPKSTAGNDFEGSYLDFDKGFAKPFSAHVRNCFSLGVRHQRSLIDDDEPSESDGSSSGLISGAPVEAVQSGSNRPSNSEGDTDDESGPDGSDNGSQSGDEDQESHSVDESDRHGSSPSGSQSPAPSVDDHAHGSDWDVESVPIPNVGPRTPTPPPSLLGYDDGPSSPIEHAFARMARQPSSASVEKANAPEVNDPVEDFRNIDPQLLSLSAPRPEDSVLLNRGMEGFVYSPTPSHMSDASSTSQGPSTSPAANPSATTSQTDIDYTIPDARMEIDQVLESPESPAASATASRTSDAGSMGKSTSPFDAPPASVTASGTSDAGGTGKSTSPFDAPPASVTASGTSDAGGTGKSTSPFDAPRTSATASGTSDAGRVSDAGNDNGPVDILTPAEKRARTIAAKKAALAARATGDMKRSGEPVEGEGPSKRQKSVGAPVENERPRRSTRRPRRPDDSPQKK